MADVTKMMRWMPLGSSSFLVSTAFSYVLRECASNHSESSGTPMMFSSWRIASAPGCSAGTIDADNTAAGEHIGSDALLKQPGSIDDAVAGVIGSRKLLRRRQRLLHRHPAARSPRHAAARAGGRYCHSNERTSAIETRRWPPNQSRMNAASPNHKTQRGCLRSSTSASYQQAGETEWIDEQWEKFG